MEKARVCIGDGADDHCHSQFSAQHFERRHGLCLCGLDDFAGGFEAEIRFVERSRYALFGEERELRPQVASPAAPRGDGIEIGGKVAHDAVHGHGGDVGCIVSHDSS